MSYVARIPSSPSFGGKGFKGYQFGPIRNPELDIHFIDVTKSYDTYLVSKTITCLYYVIEGNGYFTIENKKYIVESGTLVEVPPNVEYSYSGAMKMLMVGTPRWVKGNEEFTKKNPDVVGGKIMSRLAEFGRLLKTMKGTTHVIMCSSRSRLARNEVAPGFFRLPLAARRAAACSA